MAVAIIAAPLPHDLAGTPDSRTRSAGLGTKNSSSKKMSANRGPPVPRGKRERPCDACRKRKSKCVVAEGQRICAACGIHGQECTYVEDPQPRKRKIDIGGSQSDQSQKRSAVSPTSDGSSATAITTGDGKATCMTQTPKHSAAPNLIADSFSHQYGTHIGHTTELEPILLGLSADQGLLSSSITYQLRGSTSFYVDEDAMEGLRASNVTAHKAVEQLVGPHGPTLLALYLERVESNFPIIHRKFFSDFETGQKQNLDPALLATIYVLAIPWLVQGGTVSIGMPDAIALEKLAFTLFTRSLQAPMLSTIQAGILLMQRPNVVSKTLNAQLVDAAFELGLQIDCSSWSLSITEKGLRKRLAWALYMQDKWCSLINGRPSAISASDWAVPTLKDEDFESWADHGSKLIFKQMVTLTEILSNVLDTFYTLKAMQEVEDAMQGGTRLILERAKPVQMKLKEWFGTLPTNLKMDAAVISATGYMHLAYFATEITLHRCIIRSLQSSNNDSYVAHVCRSAAKTRLISAMDFVNRLRPEHLNAFWYFPSRVSFALIGTFGSLLLATAPCQEEVEFYRTRLGEYRWTLGVSSRTAPFLEFAAESLDTSETLLKNLPKRPSTTEMSEQIFDIRKAQGPSPPRDESSMSDVSPTFSQGLPILVEDEQNSSTATSGLASPSASDESE